MFLGISISCNRRPLFVRSVLIVMTYIAFLFFSLTRPQGDALHGAVFLSSFQNLLKTDSTKQVGFASFLPTISGVSTDYRAGLAQ